MASLVHPPANIGLSPRLATRRHLGLPSSMVAEHDYVKQANRRGASSQNSQPMYTCNLNSSFTASTQFVSSLTTQNLDDVEQVLADYPEVAKETVAVEKQESPSKPHVVTQVVVIRPEDNEDEVVENAIRSITESLNRSAADKIAKGESPPSETVIEIVRVKQPAGGAYFSQEDLVRDKQVFIHSPCKFETVEESWENDEAEAEEELPPPRVATPSPPRYSAIHRRKPDLSATCYFDTRSSGRKLQRSVSYTVTKMAPQSLSKASQQFLQRRNDAGFVKVQERQKAQEEPIKCAVNKLNTCTDELMTDESIDDDSLLYPEQLNSSACSSTLGFSDDVNISRRPPYSYMHLIQLAICSKSDRRMTLREIYQWIEDQFPYYKHQVNKGWKNSIRHNLSLYDIFVREKYKSPSHTGSSYWTVRSNAKPKHGLQSFNRLYDSRNPATQVNLLPKPPASSPAFALIPIQSGLSVVPSKPYVVQSAVETSTSINADSLEKRPRILKRAIRSISPGYQKQPRILCKLDTSSASQHANPGHLSTRNSFPPTARSASQQPSNGKLLSLSLNSSASQLDLAHAKASGEHSPQLDTSELRQRLSLMNMRSASVDVAEVEANSDSFCIEIRSDNGNETAASETQNTSGTSQVGLPKPKMYDSRKSSRKSKLETRNCDLGEDEHFMSQELTPKKKQETKRTENVSVSTDEFSEADVPELLSTFCSDLATPIKMMLSTPPKTWSESILSSTPISTIGDMPSPLGASLLGGLTPFSISKFSPRALDLNLDSGIFGSGGTPLRLCEQSPPYTRMRERYPSGDLADLSPQMKRITPMRYLTSPNSFALGAASPAVGSLRRLGLQGLTPRRTDAHSDSGVSPSDKSLTVEPRSLTKLFDGESEDIRDDYFEIGSFNIWPSSDKKRD